MTDPTGLKIAQHVADEIAAGHDAESLLGTLVPVLLEVARDAYGQDELIAQLELMIAEWRNPAKEKLI